MQVHLQCTIIPINAGRKCVSDFPFPTVEGSKISVRVVWFPDAKTVVLEPTGS